jgi:uncharacterized protein (TIGR03067 family)
MFIRPHCFLIALFTGVLALGLSSVQADDAEAVKEKLFQAKKAYDVEVQKFRKAVSDLLDKREVTARNAGDKKVVDQIKAEREAFEKNGEMPSMIPPNVQDPLNAARMKLDKAYSTAVKEYVRLKMDDAAEATEKEQQAFKKSSLETAADEQRFQGNWKCIRNQSLGKEWSKEELTASDLRMEVSGERLTTSRIAINDNGKLTIMDGKIRLIPDAKPKQFDWQGTDPSGIEIKWAGVYEFTGSKLRLCYRRGTVKETVTRPKWTDVRAAGVIWFEFERVKNDPKK